MEDKWDSLVPTGTRLHLVSHPLCPLNQRLVLVLLFKGMQLGEDFKVSHVELGNLPEWFHVLSPAGAMPVLALDKDRCLTIHTAAAAEFLNEVASPDLHPIDPTRRLHHRNWLSAADDALDKLRGVFTSDSESDVEQALDDIFHALAPLEFELENDACWFDDEASIVDAAFAPLFCLVLHFPLLAQDPRWRDIPRTKAWADSLIEHPIVQASKAPDYAEEFRKFFMLFDSAFSSRAAT